MFVYLFDRIAQEYHIKDYEWGYSKDMSFCGVVLPKLYSNSYAVDIPTGNICKSCLAMHKRYYATDDVRNYYNTMIPNIEFNVDFRDNKYERAANKQWSKLSKAKGKQAGNKFYEKVHQSQNLSKYKKY